MWYTNEAVERGGGGENERIVSESQNPQRKGERTEEKSSKKPEKTS